MTTEPVSRKDLEHEAQRARVHARALQAASACLRRECLAARARLNNLRLRALLNLDRVLQQRNAAQTPPPPDQNLPGVGGQIPPPDP